MKPESQECEGHRIEVRGRDKKTELRIDDVPVSYGQLPNGQFYLDQYAYDWTDDLMELGRRYVSHRRRAEEIRNPRKGK
jgi:hypothetical protein